MSSLPKCRLRHLPIVTFWLGDISREPSLRPTSSRQQSYLLNLSYCVCRCQAFRLMQFCGVNDVLSIQKHFGRDDKVPTMTSQAKAQASAHLPSENTQGSLNCAHRLSDPRDEEICHGISPNEASCATSVGVFCGQTLSISIGTQ